MSGSQTTIPIVKDHGSEYPLVIGQVIIQSEFAAQMIEMIKRGFSYELAADCLFINPDCERIDSFQIVASPSLPSNTLRKALSNLLSAVAKQHDAPCSASTHMDTAISSIASLVDWRPEDPELVGILSDAMLNTLSEPPDDAVREHYNKVLLEIQEEFEAVVANDPLVHSAVQSSNRYDGIPFMSALKRVIVLQYKELQMWREDAVRRQLNDFKHRNVVKIDTAAGFEVKE